MERSTSKYLSSNTNSFNVTSTYKQTNTHIIHPTILADERSRILSWLSPLEPWKRHHDLAACRVAGVGEWVLKAREFQGWRCRKEDDTVDEVLFCYGAPGAEKTFVCSLAIDTLCDETAGRNVGIACLYCDYRGQEGQMPTNMIGSLLKQMVAGLPEVPRDINQAFQRAKRQLGGRALLLPKIVDLFPKVLELYEQAFIFVDALDELRVEYRAEFIQSLQQIIRVSPNIQLFITGRVHVLPELDRHLTRLPSMISIRPKDEDLRTYLTRRLDADPDPDAMTDGLKREILTHLPQQFSGLFLPIALQADAILCEPTSYNRREVLYRTADVLGGVYNTTLVRIRRQCGSRARLGIAVLTSISLAGGALHVDELRHSLAITEKSHDLNIKGAPSLQTLLTSCLGLVTFDRETSIVHLVYILSNRGDVIAVEG